VADAIINGQARKMLIDPDIARTTGKYHFVALAKQESSQLHIRLDRPAPLCIVSEQIARSTGRERDASLSDPWERVRR
jgi:hypothetical protein